MIHDKNLLLNLIKDFITEHNIKIEIYNVDTSEDKSTLKLEINDQIPPLLLMKLNHKIQDLYSIDNEVNVVQTTLLTINID